MKKSILVITGDGGECYETLYAVHRFREAGYEPRIAAPSRKRLNLVIHDFEPGWDTYIERPGYQVASDLEFAEVRVDDYVAVLVLGGRAPEYLRNDARVLAIVREFHERDKWIFGICHGVQVLASAGLGDRRARDGVRALPRRRGVGGRGVRRGSAGGATRADGDRTDLAVPPRVLSRSDVLPVQRVTVPESEVE